MEKVLSFKSCKRKPEIGAQSIESDVTIKFLKGNFAIASKNSKKKKKSFRSCFSHIEINVSQNIYMSLHPSSSRLLKLLLKILIKN